MIGRSEFFHLPAFSETYVCENRNRIGTRDRIRTSTSCTWFQQKREKMTHKVRLQYQCSNPISLVEWEKIRNTSPMPSIPLKTLL
jgi:hypothetical protein